MSTAYEEIQAINWSSLKHMGVSPLEFRWHLDHAAPRKKAFIFGGAAHTATLEPEKFDQRYAVYDGTRDARHTAYKTWLAEHPGVEALKSPEVALVKAMAEKVHSDRNAGPLLKGGRREEAVTWVDEVTGLACKGRLDYIRPDLVVDLKTTVDPTPRKFERAAFDYGYAAQLAFYHDGAIAARLIDGRQRPYIIAVKKSGAHDVVTFQLKQETLELGRAVYRALLRRLVECTAANWWPGVAPEVQQLGVPPWASADQLFTTEEQDEETF